MFIKTGGQLINTAHVVLASWGHDSLTLSLTGEFSALKVYGDRAWGVWMALQKLQVDADDLEYLRAITCPHHHDFHHDADHATRQCSRCGKAEPVQPIDTSELRAIVERTASILDEQVSADAFSRRLEAAIPFVEGDWDR